MNQLPPVPALGLTLAIPRDKVQRAIEAEISKGMELIKERVTTQEALDDLKRKNWSWVLSAAEVLKQCFPTETVALYFSSNVYVQPSVKLNDLERELDEFPFLVRGRIDRLRSLLLTVPVIPEPPNNDFLSAQFHPRIYKATWRPFELAQYGTAISAAVQEVEDAVKEATTGNIQKTGAELVSIAFNPQAIPGTGAPTTMAAQLTSPGEMGVAPVAPTESGFDTGMPVGPLVDDASSMNDKLGVRDLFAGFMNRYKNLPPQSIFDIHETARILSLASYLVYVVDSRRPKEEAKEKFEFELLKPE